jgi:hypothetical protein
VGHYSSFILRLWVEPPDGPRWGIIQHVTSRDKLRFQVGSEEALTEVIEFIRKHSAEGELALPFALTMGEPIPTDGDGAAEDGRKSKDGGRKVTEVTSDE